MKSVLPLFVYIDACGWEIVKNDAFAGEFAPLRQRLKSVLGYSSASVASILSGKWPAQHRNWNYFVYDPENSPFRGLRPLRWLPARVARRRLFRRMLSKGLKAKLNLEGRFDLYNLPFEHVSLFDFTEKKHPLRPGGMNRGTNIFDHLEQEGIAYHVSVPGQTEEANLAAAVQDIQSERIDFAFLHWPGLGALLSLVGNESSSIGPKLRLYEGWMAQLLEAARGHYRDIRVYVFGDHGMADCDELLNLKLQIDALSLQMPEDYAVVYDSTMARFWFFNDRARRLIEQQLALIPQGRVLDDQELEHLGILFPDRYFGELVFLVNEGVLILPNHMGEHPVKAMRGYHPDEPHSFAVLCTNRPGIPSDINAIPQVFELMVQEAGAALRANANGKPVGAR